jgi:hypothetical protein
LWQGEYLHAKINHLQLIELNTVRPLLPHAFDQINRWEYGDRKKFLEAILWIRIVNFRPVLNYRLHPDPCQIVPEIAL